MLSAIPAYLLAGLLLGPNEPNVLEPDPPVRGDGVRRRARDHLPPLLPRPRVHARPPARSGRHVALGGTIDLIVNAAARSGRGRRRVRARLRRAHPRRRDLRLVERDHRQGADRLPPPRRRRDRPRARDPRLRGHRDRARARFRRRRRRRARLDAGRSSRRRSRFIGVSLAASRWLSRPIDRVLERLPREFFLLARSLPRRHGRDRRGARPLGGDRRAHGRRRARRNLASARRSRSASSASATSSRRCSSSSSGSRSTSARSQTSAGCSPPRSP